MTAHDDLSQLSWLVEQTVEHVSVKLNPRRVVVRLAHRPTGLVVTEQGLSSDSASDARLSAYHSLHRLLEVTRSAGPPAEPDTG